MRPARFGGRNVALKLSAKDVADLDDMIRFFHPGASLDDAVRIVLATGLSYYKILRSELEQGRAED